MLHLYYKLHLLWFPQNALEENRVFYQQSSGLAGKLIDGTCKKGISVNLIQSRSINVINVSTPVLLKKHTQKEIATQTD